MTSVPREYLDGMAEFVAGIQSWTEWRWWFARRAARLVRVMDRPLFEELKRQPEETVATLLRHEGITIRQADPPHPDPVRPEEYEVYTALCRQLDLFQFNRPDTIFENHTDGDELTRRLKRRLEFDEARREYRVVDPDLTEGFVSPFRQWFTRHPHMLSQYESRNQHRWELEKRFEVENGYRLMSELGEHERSLAQGAFCLSRVGFSFDGEFALVFIRYSISCSYYLIFEKGQTRWERAEFRMAWVT